MKGVIVACLKDLVVTEFGEDKWDRILDESGVGRHATFLPIDDIDDDAVMGMVRTTCDVLGISMQQAADAFGEHWVCTFAPKMYAAYYGSSRSAKEFLTQLDDIHVATTRTIRNAHPPRFDYEYVDEDSLVMEYKSERGLMVFFTGLVRGVGKHFGENVEITPVGTDKVRIDFGRA